MSSKPNRGKKEQKKKNHKKKRDSQRNERNREDNRSKEAILKELEKVSLENKNLKTSLANEKEHSKKALDSISSLEKIVEKIKNDHTYRSVDRMDKDRLIFHNIPNGTTKRLLEEFIRDKIHGHVLHELGLTYEHQKNEYIKQTEFTNKRYGARTSTAIIHFIDEDVCKCALEFFYGTKRGQRVQIFSNMVLDIYPWVKEGGSNIVKLNGVPEQCSTLEIKRTLWEFGYVTRIKKKGINTRLVNFLTTKAKFLCISASIKRKGFILQGWSGSKYDRRIFAEYIHSNDSIREDCILFVWTKKVISIDDLKLDIEKMPRDTACVRNIIPHTKNMAKQNMFYVILKDRQSTKRVEKFLSERELYDVSEYCMKYYEIRIDNLKSDKMYDKKKIKAAFMAFGNVVRIKYLGHSSSDQYTSSYRVSFSEIESAKRCYTFLQSIYGVRVQEPKAIDQGTSFFDNLSYYSKKEKKDEKRPKDESVAEKNENENEGEYVDENEEDGEEDVELEVTMVEEKTRKREENENYKKESHFGSDGSYNYGSTYHRNYYWRRGGGGGGRGRGRGRRGRLRRGRGRGRGRGGGYGKKGKGGYMKGNESSNK